MLNVIKGAGSSGGVEVKELRDSWSKAVDVLEELEKEGHVILLRNGKGEAKLAYFDDVSLRINVSDEFKDMWHAVQVPGEEVLESELEAVGIRGLRQAKKKGEVKVKEKRKRKGGKLKVTNTHLEGIGTLMLVCVM